VSLQETGTSQSCIQNNCHAKAFILVLLVRTCSPCMKTSLVPTPQMGYGVWAQD